MEVSFVRTNDGPVELYEIGYTSTQQCNVDVAFVKNSGYWYDATGTLHPVGSVFSTQITNQIPPSGLSLGVSNI